MDIKTLNLLKQIKLKKKIVLCHGVFDVIHSGHLKYFEQAKKYGDILVVSVTADKYVNKGPNRPVNNLKSRIEILKNLKVVDFVLESNFATAQKIIEKIKPDIYCKGPDYKNKISGDIRLQNEVKALNKVKGKFITVTHQALSSSKIIKKANLDINNDKISKYIKSLRKKYSADFLYKQVSKLYLSKTLVLGEMIVDKYVFAEAIGKSGKDSMLVFKEKNDKQYIGGTGYISNLCSTFVKNIDYIFHIGSIDNKISFIKKNLSKKINYKYFKKNNSPTIQKLRYVDYYKNTKIMGFYNINDDQINSQEEKKYLVEINKKIKKNKIIIVTDYAHGEFTNKIRKFIQKSYYKVFLNTQINSFNSTYHTMRNYKKVNTLCINESELRHEMRDSKSSIQSLANNLKKQLKFKNLIVTQGKFGATLFNNKNKTYYVPAFESNPIDSIGSGDTFFSIISLCLGSNLNEEISLLFASLAASYSVKNIGSKDYFTKDNLINDIKHLF